MTQPESEIRSTWRHVAGAHHDGYVDTLLILASGEDDDALWPLASTWQADELTWLDQDQAASMFGASYIDIGGRVLVVWWD